MKRFLSLFLALMLIGSVAVAESIDYASLSDEELHAIINAARNELTKRELVADEKTVICDQDDVQVYLTGRYKWNEGSNESIYLVLEAVIINNSQYELSISIDSISVNGWDVWAGGPGTTNAGKKKKGEFNIKVSDAEIKKFGEIEDIEFHLELYDMGAWKTINEIPTVTVHYNK